MIAFLEGKIQRLEASAVYVNCNGVGYRALISLNTFSALKDKEAAFLHTYLRQTDTEQVLYGFVSQREQVLFTRLISVNGVGGSTALALLSSMSPAELEEAIATEDVARLKAVKGIGAKTAGRIVLDLKGKLPIAEEVAEPTPPGQAPVVSAASLRAEALEALVSLGMNRQQMAKKLDTILKSEAMPASVEELIKAALKN